MYDGDREGRGGALSHHSSTTILSPWVLISTVYNVGDEILIYPLWLESTITHSRRVETDLQIIIH